jgi:hypothetical protein
LRRTLIRERIARRVTVQERDAVLLTCCEHLGRRAWDHIAVDGNTYVRKEVLASTVVWSCSDTFGRYRT